ncbi:hypothetical protein NDU88_007810 [Pleurodeles waltl]|uniref:Uncharacterized protein n=1 Tax=Pleurodeles waltl TaxID=8319 RepID=A0AAV7STF9_PLEWA|nr:hypothetical protein NDU88_007810 [Pleurodeles waltl]
MALGGGPCWQRKLPARHGSTYNAILKKYGKLQEGNRPQTGDSQDPGWYWQATTMALCVEPEGKNQRQSLWPGRSRCRVIREVNNHPVGWKQTLARKEGVVVPEVKGHPAGLEADAYPEETEWMHRK